MDKKVVVYMEFVNYLGEVIESKKIAEFVSIAWATPFIEYAEKQCMSKTTRIRWEEEE